MASTEPETVLELEDRLKEVGHRLLSPPSSIDELLQLLDQTESLLSRVEQSPTAEMSKSLRPAMSALVAKEFLGHSDMDVKVAVASCVSEITRITAPEAPYDDDLMKEVFQRIVEAFENLDDMSSRSFTKRVSILETVAKVRSCVVMLDLECDALILEMFRYFFKTIRPSHPENIFSSMVTIMTLVLEESEDISEDLILCLLDSVKNNDKDVFPDAQRLGKEVIRNCAAKLKPYLLTFFNSKDATFSHYSEIVASVCQESSDGAEQNEINLSGETMADDSKQSDRTVSDELPQGSAKMEQEVGCLEKLVDASEKSTEPLSNGSIQGDGGETTVEPSSLNQKSERSSCGSQSKRSAVANTDVSDNVDSIPVKQGAVPDLRAKKMRGRLASSSIHLKEGVEHSQVDGQLGNEAEPSGKQELQPSSEADYGTAKSSSPTRIESPEATRPKRGRPPSKRRGNTAVAQQPALSSAQEALDNIELEDRTSPLNDANPNKESDGISDSKRKKLKRSGKIVQLENTDEVGTLDKLAGDSEVKSQRLTGKRGSSSKLILGESTEKQHKSNVKQQDKLRPEKETRGELVLKEMFTSPKSIKKDTRAQSNSVESPKSASRRKRVHDAEEIFETPARNKGLDASLVGSKIKVWWPDDKQFYDGIVDSYDSSTKKHKILYNDGDVEVLLLKKERWEFVKDDTEKDLEHIKDTSSPDALPESRSKRLKTSSSSTPKEKNVETPLKSGTGSSSVHGRDLPKRKGRQLKSRVSRLGLLASDDSPSVSAKLKENSSGKSRDGSSKSSTKLKKDESPNTDKPTSKTGSSSREQTSKSGRKSSGDSDKAASKNKDDASRTGSKHRRDAHRSKLSEDSPRVGRKYRGRTTPKSGGESKVNGAAERGKSKVHENDSTTKMQSGTVKTPDSEGSAGKKRKRKGH